MIIVLDDNQYGVFYAVNDNWELQLLFVNCNYHVLITITDTKGRCVLKNLHISL